MQKRRFILPADAAAVKPGRCPNDGRAGSRSTRVDPIVSRFHLRSYPTVIVLDDDGNIRSNQGVAGVELDKLVDRLLAELEAKPK